MKISEHFSLEELTFTDHRRLDNTPSGEQIENLKRLAVLLEQVRSLLGNVPIIVNSAFRSQEVNRAVGGKDTSQHCLGCAADFRVPGMTPDDVVRAIKNSSLGYDQVIREFDRWTHVSIPNAPDTQPRQQALIIDKAGTQAFA